MPPRVLLGRRSCNSHDLSLEDWYAGVYGLPTVWPEASMQAWDTARNIIWQSCQPGPPLVFPGEKEIFRAMHAQVGEEEQVVSLPTLALRWMHPSKTGFLHDSYPCSAATVVTPLGSSGPGTRPVRYPHNKYLQSSH